MLALFGAKVGADSRACAARDDELEPILARVVTLAGDDFDDVAVLELVPQRHDGPVHARSGAAVTDFRVNRVGEDGTGKDYNGQSKIVDPRGNDLVDLGDQEVMKTIAISHDALTTFRQKFAAHLDADSFTIN